MSYQYTRVTGFDLDIDLEYLDIIQQGSIVSGCDLKVQQSTWTGSISTVEYLDMSYQYTIVTGLDLAGYQSTWP